MFFTFGVFQIEGSLGVPGAGMSDGLSGNHGRMRNQSLWVPGGVWSQG